MPLKPLSKFLSRIYQHPAVPVETLVVLHSVQVYVDLSRTFGGRMDDPRVRLRYYFDLLDEELAAWEHAKRAGEGGL